MVVDGLKITIRNHFLGDFACLKKIKYLLWLLTSAAQAIIVTHAALNCIYAVNKVQNNVQVCECVCVYVWVRERENLV